MVTAITAVVGFIVTLLLGFVLIPYLKKLHFGQTILEIGPKWHKNKQGTPIMGGLMFMAGTLIAVIIGFVSAYLIGGDENAIYLTALNNKAKLIRLIAGVVMAYLMAFIGFMDDYIKAVKKQNLGLKASQKTVLQIIVSAVYLITLYLSGVTTVGIPFFGYVNVTSGVGIIFWPVALVFIYFFTNAVNLTDGVDGLAGSVTIVVSLFFMIATLVTEAYGFTIVSAALAGSLIGFLAWNLHPAKVFMGDTGSMFLGGMVVALAFATGRPFVLLLAGVLYLIEALSVVIQVTYFKLTHGKRIFKMSPIHHHFEMCGWKENKIVIIFSLIAFVGCAVSLSILLI